MKLIKDELKLTLISRIEDYHYFVNTGIGEPEYKDMQQEIEYIESFGKATLSDYVNAIFENNLIKKSEEQDYYNAITKYYNVYTIDDLSCEQWEDFAKLCLE